MLPRHARCVLSRLRCNGHSLLSGSDLSRIGRIENPSCSACGHLSSHSALSSYGLFAPHALWRLSVSVRPLVQTLGSCPDSVAPWSSAMPPSLGRGPVTNNNNRTSGWPHFWKKSGSQSLTLPFQCVNFILFLFTVIASLKQPKLKLTSKYVIVVFFYNN